MHQTPTPTPQPSNPKPNSQTSNPKHRTPNDTHQSPNSLYAIDLHRTMVTCTRCPLSGEQGTHKTVKAGFWRCLSDKSHLKSLAAVISNLFEVISNLFKAFPLQSHTLEQSAMLTLHAFDPLGIMVTCTRHPLSSEQGTNKTVKARFWRWLSDKSHLKPFKVFPFRPRSLNPTPSSRGRC